MAKQATLQLVRRGSEWILRTRFPAVPAAVGLLLTSGSLFVGMQADDFFIRNVVTQSQPFQEVLNNPWEPYTYLDGHPEHNQMLIDRGWFPWWTDPQARASLGRPLTALTQLLDYRVWPGHPAIMHLHSLVWYGALIFVMALLYRRMASHESPGGAGWWVGLAALMFAVDEAHGIPAGWLANRNSLIAALFGAFAVLLHDYWRRGRNRWAGVLAPAALLLGVLGKEEAAAAGGYLLAYAIFLERSTIRTRCVSLLPYILVGGVWLVWYKLTGYGATHSGLYVDPIAETGRFMARAWYNVPILLCAQFGTPPADVAILLSEPLLRWHWLWAVLVCCVALWLCRPLLRESRVACFWALGTALAVLPLSAVFPSDRLLMMPSLGAMGLIAMWVAHVASRESWAYATSRVHDGIALLLVASHLVLAAALLPLTSSSLGYIGGLLNRIYDTLPVDESIQDQTIVLANTFTAVGDLGWIQDRIMRGLPIPARHVNLGAACQPSDITRIDERTIVVRPLGGYLLPGGRRLPGDWFASPVYLARHLDGVVRSDDRPFEVGQVIALPTVRIRVLELTAEQRPAAVEFRFSVALEDPSLRWLQVSWDGYRPYVPPAVGSSDTLASP